MYFARKTGILQAERENDFKKNIGDKNDNFISNLKFTEKEKLSYPKLSKLNFGKVAKAFSMIYNDAPITIPISALLTLLSVVCRGIKIFQTVNHFIYPNLFICTIGAPATCKSPIMRKQKDLLKDILKKYVKLLQKHCGVYAYPLTQMVADSVGSFGAFMQRSQFTMDMIAYQCDEISAANRTFQLDTKSSEAAGSICTAFDGHSLSRKFMDSQFESEIDHPYWTINITTQAGPCKNMFKKWIQTGATQRFIFEWAKFEKNKISSNRKLCNTSGITTEHQNIFSDVLKHVTLNGCDFFIEGLLNDYDRYSIVFDDECDVILSINDLCLDKYVIALKKINDNNCDFEYMQGVISKTKNHIVKIAGLLYMFEYFYNLESITCLNDKHFINNLIPKATLRTTKRFMVKDPNLVLAAIECALHSLTAFCWLFDFGMVHISFDVNNIIKENIYPLIKKKLEVYKVKLDFLKRKKYLNSKDENDDLEKNLNDTNNAKQNNIFCNNIYLEEDDEISSIEIERCDIINENNNNNHNKNHNNKNINDNINNEVINNNSYFDPPIPSSDEDSEDEAFNNETINDNKLIQDMKYQEEETLIGLVITLPGTVLNITNIKTKLSLKASLLLDPIHYDKFIELTSSELQFKEKNHTEIRKYIINILIFLSTKDFGFFVKTNFIGSSSLYYKPDLKGLKRWLNRDSIDNYDLNVDDDKYKTKSLLSFLARCRVPVSVFIYCAELKNRFNPRKNNQKVDKMPDYWNYKEAKKHVTDVALNIKPENIEKTMLSPPLNYEEICISMEYNLKDKESIYTTYYTKIKSNKKTSNYKNKYNDSNISKESKVDDVSSTINYFDNNFNNNKNTYRKKLTCLPSLIDDALKSGIGKKCLNMIKKRKELKNEYFNNLKNSEVAKYLCDPDKPIDTLIPTPNNHQLQVCGSFDNLKYKRFVEEYRKKYNITADEYDTIINSNDDERTTH